MFCLEEEMKKARREEKAARRRIESLKRGRRK